MNETGFYNRRDEKNPQKQKLQLRMGSKGDRVNGKNRQENPRIKWLK